ncbi:MAG: HAD family phosphatase [Lachnospiraceae bacterium]|nr:HAD family phosphatase [Lachnospiraceae bacterium]
MFKGDFMDRVEEILKNLEPIIKDKKGLIFDVDGTLLDSMPMWKRLDVEYLSSLGLIPEPDFQNKVKMMTMLDAARYINNYFGLDKEPEVIAKEIQDIAYSYYENELLIKPGAFELLAELKKRGYKMVVGTANEYDMCKSALVRNNVMDFFEDLVTCSMVGCSKERPDVYLLACEKMGLSMEDCVIFEDSYFAINTATKAGFSVIGVYDDTEEENWENICKITDGQVVF